MASKRELDKESMFRKIMPSAAQTQAADSKTDAAAAGAPLPEEAPLLVAPSTENAAPQTEPTTAPEPSAQQAEPTAVAPAPAPQAGDGGKLSQDAIAALFAQQDNTDSIPDAPAEPTTAPEPPAQQAEPTAVAPAPAPQAGDGGKLSPAAIAAIFAQQHAKTEALAAENADLFVLADDTPADAPPVSNNHTQL